MLSKLKLILGGALAIIVALFVAFTKGSKANQNEIKAETEEVAREHEVKAKDATIDGLEKEAAINAENIDTTNRDHFS